MGNAKKSVGLSPLTITASYLLFGVLWILVTDSVVRGVVDTPGAMARLQTIKGWLFVLLSTGLIYGLTHTHEAQLMGEREFTTLALDSLSDMFLVLSPDGVIQRVNSHTAAVLGHDESELEGSAATEYVVEPDRDDVEEAILSAYEHGQSRVAPTVLTNDGARIRYEFRGRRMDAAEGTVRGIAVIGRDITDQVLNEQKLDVTLRVLRHNLRNKLNIVRGAAETISGTDEATADADTIVATTDELLELSESARHMIELSEGSEPACGEREVAALVSNVVDEIRVGFPGVDLETELPANAGKVARSRQLEIALRNIVENAVEHNDADSPWVRVSVQTTAETAEVRVQDNGSGIPASQREVFEMESETPLHHGEGLGLWLAKWCVAVLGGSMELDRRSPTGTEVVLEVPLSSGTED